MATDHNIWRHTWRRSAAAATLALAAGVLPLTPASAQTPPPLKLGIVTFLSGPAAGPFGIPGAQRRRAADRGDQCRDPAGSLQRQGLRRPADRADHHRREWQHHQGGAGLSRPRRAARRQCGRRLHLLRQLPWRRAGGRGAQDADRVLRLRHAAHLRGRGSPLRLPAFGNLDDRQHRRGPLPRQGVPGIKSYGGLNQNYAWGQDSWSDFEGAMKDLKPGPHRRHGAIPQALRRPIQHRDHDALGERRRRRAFELLGRRPRELHSRRPIRAVSSRRRNS